MTKKHKKLTELVSFVSVVPNNNNNRFKVLRNFKFC